MSLEIKKFKVDIIYHKITDGILEEIKIGDDIYRLVRSETKPEIKKQKGRKGKILGVEDTYGVKIYSNEVTLVLDELLKKECSTIEIVDQIGLKKSRVGAIIKWLKNHGIIKRKRNDEGGTVYQLLKKDWRP